MMPVVSEVANVAAHISESQFGHGPPAASLDLPRQLFLWYRRLRASSLSSLAVSSLMIFTVAGRHLSDIHVHAHGLSVIQSLSHLVRPPPCRARLRTTCRTRSLIGD